MFCSKCGNQCDGAFCAVCGTPVKQSSSSAQAASSTQSYQANDTQNFQPQTATSFANAPQQNVSQDTTPQLSMKWYKFLIYFALFFSALINASNGALMLSGGHYGEDADMIYDVWSELQGLDTAIGALSLVLAVFIIITRFSLAKFRKNAITMLTLMYVFNFLIGIAYVIGINSILPSEALQYIDFSSTYSQLGISISFMIANLGYFNKRKHLFVN